MYAIRNPSNNLLKVFVISQVIASLALGVSPNNAGAQVGDKEEVTAVHAVVPGQRKNGVEGKWI